MAAVFALSGKIFALNSWEFLYNSESAKEDPSKQNKRHEGRPERKKQMKNVKNKKLSTHP